MRRATLLRCRSQSFPIDRIGAERHIKRLSLLSLMRRPARAALMIGSVRPFFARRPNRRTTPA